MCMTISCLLMFISSTDSPNQYIPVECWSQCWSFILSLVSARLLPHTDCLLGQLCIRPMHASVRMPDPIPQLWSAARMVGSISTDDYSEDKSEMEHLCDVYDHILSPDVDHILHRLTQYISVSQCWPYPSQSHLPNIFLSPNADHLSYLWCLPGQLYIRPMHASVRMPDPIPQLWSAARMAGSIPTDDYSEDKSEMEHLCNVYDHILSPDVDHILHRLTQYISVSQCWPYPSQTHLPNIFLSPNADHLSYLWCLPGQLYVRPMHASVRMPDPIPQSWSAARMVGSIPTDDYSEDKSEMEHLCNVYHHIVSPDADHILHRLTQYISVCWPYPPQTHITNIFPSPDADHILHRLTQYISVSQCWPFIVYC